MEPTHETVTHHGMHLARLSQVHESRACIMKVLSRSGPRRPAARRPMTSQWTRRLDVAAAVNVRAGPGPGRAPGQLAAARAHVKVPLEYDLNAPSH